MREEASKRIAALFRQDSTAVFSCTWDAWSSTNMDSYLGEARADGCSARVCTSRRVRAGVTFHTVTETFDPVMFTGACESFPVRCAFSPVRTP